MTDPSDGRTLDALPPLRDVIARHGLRAEKKLGQNFLLDANITDKIVRAAGDLSRAHVIEVGPGPGGLTRSLLRAGAGHVHAIEYDPRAVAALAELENVAGGRLTVSQADALAADYKTAVPAPRWIVANLPYNIATPLLLGWLRLIREDQGFVAGMALMFQREVADRIVAPPGGKDLWAAIGRLPMAMRGQAGIRHSGFGLRPGAESDFERRDVQTEAERRRHARLRQRRGGHFGGVRPAAENDPFKPGGL